MEDVFSEVANLMSNLHVNMHKIKECTRKYAFELPNIPKEGKYLKLMYPYDSESPCSNCQFRADNGTQNQHYPWI